VREEVYGEFARIQAAEKLAATSITMLALVHRADARLELNPPEPDTNPLPVLVPAVKPTANPEPATHQTAGGAHGVTRPTIAPQSSDLPKPKTSESQTEPGAKAAQTRSITEPAPDEERDFPL